MIGGLEAGGLCRASRYRRLGILPDEWQCPAAARHDGTRRKTRFQFLDSNRGDWRSPGARNPGFECPGRGTVLVLLARAIVGPLALAGLKCCERLPTPVLAPVSCGPVVPVPLSRGPCRDTLSRGPTSPHFDCDMLPAIGSHACSRPDGFRSDGWRRCSVSLALPLGAAVAGNLQGPARARAHRCPTGAEHDRARQRFGGADRRQTHCHRNFRGASRTCPPPHSCAADSPRSSRAPCWF